MKWCGAAHWAALKDAQTHAIYPVVSMWLHIGQQQPKTDRISVCTALEQLGHHPASGSHFRYWHLLGEEHLLDVLLVYLQKLLILIIEEHFDCFSVLLHFFSQVF